MLLCLTLLGSCAGEGDQQQVTRSFKANEGEKLPALSFTTIDGDRLDLSAYEDRPVLFNFWASWCKPCREEFPRLEKMRASYDIEIIGVVFEDTTERARAYRDKMRAPWPMVVDPDSVIAKGFGVSRPPGIPQTAFVERGGVYRTKILGEMSEQLLEATIEELSPRRR